MVRVNAFIVEAQWVMTRTAVLRFMFVGLVDGF